MLFLALLLKGCLSIISIAGFSVYYGISPMPSNRHARQAILSMIPSNFQGKIYDLGSGFGTLAYLCAKKMPYAQIVGYEISPIPYFISKIFFRQKNLTFIRKNYLKQDLSQADIVVCYLFPKGMKQLEKREWKELISNCFAFRDQKPYRTLQLRDLYRSHVYHYKK